MPDLRTEHFVNYEFTFSDGQVVDEVCINTIDGHMMLVELVEYATDGTIKFDQKLQRRRSQRWPAVLSAGARLMAKSLMTREVKNNTTVPLVVTYAEKSQEDEFTVVTVWETTIEPDKTSMFYANNTVLDIRVAKEPLDV